MKEFLFALFYQVIGAVEAAVIIGGIVWLAKRKDEKGGRKPNPDFTPPQTRHSGGYQPKPSGMPKPPTTGSAAIKPKYGISAGEAAKLVSKLAEASACLGGNIELDELRERVKEFADRLDRVEKKPVTPERLKEAGFEVEHVNVFNPAEESVKRYETDFINAKCGDCKRYATGLYGGYCVLRRCPVKAHEKRQCRFFEKYEAPVRTTHICKNCKHYLATEEGAATGLCGMKDEIVFGNNYSACFEKRKENNHERQNL